MPRSASTYILPADSVPDSACISQTPGPRGTTWSVRSPLRATCRIPMS